MIAIVVAAVIVLFAAVWHYSNRPYLAVIDDLELTSKTDAEGNEKEMVLLSYSSKNGRYGKISLPRKSMEKHLPDVKVGDKILKYRGHTIPKKCA